MGNSSLTNLILLALEKSIDGYVKFEDFAYNPHKYVYGYPNEISKPYLAKALKRLREKGLIELVSDKELILRLTNDGIDKAIIEKVKISSDEWDGKWRIVIFDIPEKRRAARDVLRSRLKEWRFRHLQKSVWVSKKNYTSILRHFIRQVGIEDWVLILEVDKSGIETKLLRS